MPNDDEGSTCFPCLLHRRICQRHHQVDEASDVVCIFYFSGEVSKQELCYCHFTKRSSHGSNNPKRLFTIIYLLKRGKILKRFCLETASFYITCFACGCHISSSPMVHFFLLALALCLSACVWLRVLSSPLTEDSIYCLYLLTFITKSYYLSNYLMPAPTVRVFTCTDCLLC